MKKIFKIFGIIILVILLLIAILFIKAAITPMVPNNYMETVETGGDIEKKYLSNGGYEVSYFECKRDDRTKKIEIFYPTEMEKKNKEYPVVIFVNGTGVKASKYKSLFKHLASWGFIAVGNEEEESWNGEASEISLNYILGENENAQSIFYKKIDTENIGITGHSQGGAGVFNSITKFENSNMYKVAVSISPTNEEITSSLSWSYDLTKINIPIFLLAGTKGEFETEVVIPYENMVKMYDKIPSEKVMARKIDMEHGDMLFCADGYVTAWFMYKLQDDLSAAKAFIGEDAELFNNRLYSNQQKSLLNLD